MNMMEKEKEEKKHWKRRIFWIRRNKIDSCMPLILIISRIKSIWFTTTEIK
jgi:hypothetical protein